jgi:hypothetical protein
LAVFGPFSGDLYPAYNHEFPFFVAFPGDFAYRLYITSLERYDSIQSIHVAICLVGFASVQYQVTVGTLARRSSGVLSYAEPKPAPKEPKKLTRMKAAKLDRSKKRLD